MARIRTLEPEFWCSEQVMELSIAARLAFIGMWNFCDDRGVHAASDKRLKAEVFPSDDITSDGVGDLVAELVRQGLVGEFAADGQRYWHITGWAKHQKIEKPTYRHPEPPESTTTQREFPEDSPSGRRALAKPSTPEGKGMEGKGTEGSELPRKRVAHPHKTTIPEGFAVSEQVRQWAASKGYQDLDAHHEAFVSKAKAKGYAYADWDAALMNAIRSDWAGLSKVGCAPDAAPVRQRVDL